jgi:hypothetical protein
MKNKNNYLAACILALLLAPTMNVYAVGNDKDGDGFANNDDNCPNEANADQLDTEADGKGDVCDTDDDNDGVLDEDELLNGSDPLLGDTDGDGLSDAVDPAPLDKLGVLQEIGGDGAGEKWATSLASGDIDMDGIDDVLVGTPYDRVYIDVNGKQVGLFHAGTVRVFSGFDGQEIVASRISGSVANQRLGAAIAVVPDQDVDGKPDIAVGEPLANVTTTINEKIVTLKGAGRVSLYSGATGEWIRTVAEGKKASDRFGSALAVGNVNSAGSDDLIVGAPMADVQTMVNSKLVTLRNKPLIKADAGKVMLFSGLSNTSLLTMAGTNATDRLGTAIASGDFDDDGLPDLALGATQFDVSTTVNTKIVKLSNAGRAMVYSAS